jgi:translation initiation factor 3 subunit C
MSRFFQAGSSSDESGSGSDSSSDEELVQQVGRGKFGTAFDSDSDSEDEGRVVKSKKDKTWDDMREGIKRLNNAMSIGDWSVVQDEFDKMNVLVVKSKQVIAKSGLPKMYIRTLGEVEANVLTSVKDKQGVKALKKAAAQSLNRMKLTVRKHNKAYEMQINQWRANPVDFEEPKEDSESSGSSSDSSDSNSDSDSDSDSDSGSDSGSESESGSDEEESDSDLDGSDLSSDSEDEDEADGRPELMGRAKWLKKTTDTVAEGQNQKAARKIFKDAQREENKDKDFKVAGKQAAKNSAAFDEDMDEETLDKKVIEVVGSRGRKGTDVKQVLRQLEVLSKIARTFSGKKEIPILMHLISAMFDTHSKIDDYMELADWRSTYRYLNRILLLLKKEPELTLVALAASDALEALLANSIDSEYAKNLKAKGGKGAADAAAVEEKAEEPKVVDPNLVQVVGSMENFVVRLEEDHTKSLQQINTFTATDANPNSPTQVTHPCPQRTSKHSFLRTNRTQTPRFDTGWSSAMDQSVEF